MKSKTSSAKRRPMPHEMLRSSTNDPIGVVGGALPNAMSRSEIASYGETATAYERACTTTVKLQNLVRRIESVHSALYGDRISGATAGGNDIGYTGFFGLLREETTKHIEALDEIDNALSSIEHRTGLTSVDRTPFQVVELATNTTARPERNI